MWLMKIILLVSFFGFLESFADQKPTGFKIHKHVIEVTEISLENPVPDPRPIQDEEMVARVSVIYRTIN